jgi:carboxyl-terminal processing protease
VSVGRLLEEGHYTRQPLNTEVSKKFLIDYLELLDYSHVFFTQKDVDALMAKYGTSLGDDVLLGNLRPAYAIYDLYTQRVDDRVAKVKGLLKQPMDLKTNNTIEVSRQKAPWPKERGGRPWPPGCKRAFAGKLTSTQSSRGRTDRVDTTGSRRTSTNKTRASNSLYSDSLAQTYDPH